ncbi:uncharacterized protein LOC129778692 [Toxorhynchites rutilus septentrionalis]|uniref:uncharacterized protein LOC129778692 n=1 Tax=Toxorhynchites rutilus septentrionalis TaxID=329112 RepID=UPI002479340E|nr:uncharacterized protein LOC129778692 [Toxorhynchites rutilus septentrionalis]
MQPNDLSIPRGENQIKEKLNLHVKKRLQETSKSTKILLSPACPLVLSPKAGPSTSKTKKVKTKHATSNATSVLEINSNIVAQPPKSGSGNKPTAELLLSPGAIGGNSNDATNSSFNSVDLDPDANVSNDCHERTVTDKCGLNTKSLPRPDIFTLVLNEKKSSLMRDPEVMKLLNDLMKKQNKQ